MFVINFISLMDTGLVVAFSQHLKALFHFRFPRSHRKRLDIWIYNIRRDNWTPSANSHLCSKHFKPECIDRTGQNVRLRENAVPTIFNFPKYVQKVG